MKTFFKIVVTAIFLLFILKQINAAHVLDAVKGANLFWIICALLFSFLGFVLSVIRLHVLVNAGISFRIPFFLIFAVSWIGMFFNLVLPGQLGGDVIKIYRISKHSGQAIKSTAAIIIDRIIGFTTLILLAAAALFFGRNSLNVSVINSPIIILLVCAFLFYLVIFNENIINRFKFITDFVRWTKARHLFKEIYLSFNHYKNYPNILRIAFFISIMANICSFISAYFLFISININLNMIYFFILIPLIGMISLLPISFSGLGVQDGAYIFFFSQLGVSPAKALVISVLSHIIRFGIGSIGGLIYLFEKKLEIKSH